MGRGFFFILFLVTISNGDILEFKDGITAKVDILDTNGCKITIRRNGNIVTIDKGKLAHFIYNTDTISLANFTCTKEIENRATSLKFEESYNSDKVTGIINKFKFTKSKIRQCTLYYCKEPIIGNQFESCWEDKFKVFENDLKEKYKAVSITHEELFKLLTKSMDTNCILIPLVANFGYIDSKRIIGDMERSDIMANFDNNGAVLKAKVIVRIIDLKTKEIVYNDTSEYRDRRSKIFFLQPTQKDIAEMKGYALENALLNSMSRGRKFISKIFEAR